MEHETINAAWRLVTTTYSGLEEVPDMYGAPGEIEAIWRHNMLMEATLMAPHDPIVVISLAFATAAVVLNRHGWPGSRPFYMNVEAGKTADLIVLLREWREEFINLLKRGFMPEETK